jgi:hypothetical protein
MAGGFIAGIRARLRQRVRHACGKIGRYQLAKILTEN